MKTMKYFITAFLFLFIVSTASAQITITEQEYLSALGSANNGTSFFTQDVTGLQALVNLSGANQTWNFGTRVWTATSDSATSTLLTDPTSAPLSSNFPGATDVIKVTPVAGRFDQATFYEFLKITSSGVWTLGFAQDSNGVQSVSETFTPPEQNLAFPLTSGTTWSSSSSISAPGIPAGFTDSVTMTSTIDGYGSLVTPAVPTGTMTLREKQESITKESFGMFSLASRAFSFSWITHGFNSADISADSNQKPLTATYSMASASGVRSAANGASDPLSLYLSQNPVSNIETKLYYTLELGGPVQVEMMDALGRDVRMLQNGRASAGTNIIPIDPKTLAPGTYFIRVETDGSSAMQKLIISR
jgi:hypothetical protein